MKKRVTHEIPIDPDFPARAKDRFAASGADAPADAPAGAPANAPANAPAQNSGAEPASFEPAYRDTIDHLQRLQAEFANYRRRVERERLDTVEFAQHALMEKLVPVLDDFERAIAVLDDPRSSAAQGLLLIRDKLSRILADAGLQRIETRDAPFDPTLHEALATQPVEPERAEHVVEEMVAGYTFRNRLVRPARVCVGVDVPRAGDDSPDS